MVLGIWTNDTVIVMSLARIDGWKLMVWILNRAKLETEKIVYSMLKEGIPEQNCFLMNLLEWPILV